MARVKKLFLYFLLLSFVFSPFGFAQQGQKVDLVPLDFGILQTIVTASTTATPIPATALKGRKSLIVKNINTTATIYLGSSTVTADENSTGGFPLAYYESFQIDLGENTILYGIVSSGTAKLSVIEVR